MKLLLYVNRNTLFVLSIKSQTISRTTLRAIIINRRIVVLAMLEAFNVAYVLASSLLSRIRCLLHATARVQCSTFITNVFVSGCRPNLQLNSILLHTTSAGGA